MTTDILGAIVGIAGTFSSSAMLAYAIRWRNRSHKASESSVGEMAELWPEEKSAWSLSDTLSVGYLPALRRVSEGELRETNRQNMDDLLEMLASTNEVSKDRERLQRIIRELQIELVRLEEENRRLGIEVDEGRSAVSHMADLLSISNDGNTLAAANSLNRGLVHIFLSLGLPPHGLAGGRRPHLVDDGGSQR